jgi:hypothetical protein
MEPLVENAISLILKIKSYRYNEYQPIDFKLHNTIIYEKLKIINLSNWTFFTSCSNDNGSTQEQERKSRKCMLRFCHFQLVNNARIEDWAFFTSIGSKACGGPTGFVASLKLNTEFLDKVEKYTNYQKIQYEMGVISTCDVSPSQQV